MTRLDCLKIIFEIFKENPIIFTTGHTCREAYMLEDRASNFYMVGSMGLASSIAVGLAAFIKDTVVVVDGDGSFLMNLSGILLAKILSVKNLIHITLDNGMHASTGAQETHSKNFSFSKFASMAGYGKSKSVGNPNDFKSFLNRVAKKQSGPIFLHARISSESITTAARINISLSYISERFKNFIIMRKLNERNVF